jgi:hypothetical protein
MQTGPDLNTGMGSHGGPWEPEPVQVLLLPGSVDHKAVLLAAVQDDFLLPALEDFDLDPDIAETIMQQHFIKQFQQLAPDGFRVRVGVCRLHFSYFAPV